MRRLRPVWITAVAFHVLMCGGAVALAEPLPPAAPPSASAAREPTAAEKDKARALVLQAADAMMADHYLEAEELFKAAWELEKTYDIAGNLGHVELINKKPSQAAEHLRFSLMSLPPSEPLSQQGRVRARFEEARKQVAALRIRVSEPGAEILLDGKPAGVAPLALEVFADPGVRVVKARLDGFEPAEISVKAEKGGTLEISLELKRAAGAVPAKGPLETAGRGGPERVLMALPPVAPSRPKGASGSDIGVFLGGGALLVAGLGTGVGLTVATNKVSEEVSQTQQALATDQGPDACVPGREPALAEQCRNLEARAIEANKLRMGAAIGFGAAGASAVGVALYVLLRHASDGGTTVLPSVTRNAGALVLTGVW